MRYLKVLLLVAFIFLTLVFFFQNQQSLSQEMTLVLNLFFIPQMSSIPLPVYFIVASAFAAGAILATLFFIWNKLTMTSRLMQSKWRARSLEKELISTKKTIEAQSRQQEYREKIQKKKEQQAMIEVSTVSATPARGQNAASPKSAATIPTEELVPDPDNNR